MCNSGDTDALVKVGLWADTQVGSNDKAEVKISNNGATMTDDKTGIQYSLYGSDFTTLWTGHYNKAEANVFNNSEAATSGGVDSGIAWSWSIPVKAGTIAEKSVYNAIGDMSSLPAAKINLKKDGQVYSGQNIALRNASGDVYNTLENTGAYSIRIPEGTYDVLLNGEDTGKDITLTGTDEVETDINLYTVTIYNGDDVVSTQLISEGVLANEPAKPENDRATAEFEGWCTDSECTEAFTFDTPIAGTTDIYAYWTYQGIATVAVSNWTYGMTANKPGTASETNDASKTTYIYEGTGNTVYGPSSAAPVNAGTYKVTATLPATVFYREASAEDEFIISKATITASVVEPKVTYDGMPHGISVTLPKGYDDCTITYYSDAEHTKVVDNAYTEAGAYKVYYVVSGDNIETISGVGTVTINQEMASTEDTEDDTSDEDDTKTTEDDTSDEDGKDVTEDNTSDEDDSKATEDDTSDEDDTKTTEDDTSDEDGSEDSSNDNTSEDNTSEDNTGKDGTNGDNASTKTGDTSNVFLAMLLFALSTVTGLFAAVKSRRRTNIK